MVHGKAPIGTRPRLVRSHRPAPEPTGHHEGTKGQSQAGSDPGAGQHQPILTVLKRSVAGWVKEAMK